MKKRALSLLLALMLAVSLCPAAAASYTEMTFSDGAVDYIKTGEGYRAMPYSDGTGWYIGYGCACTPGDYPNGITEAEAEALLRTKMESYAAAINSFLKRYDIGVTQGQFDAMCGMTYNFGPVWLDSANRLPSYLIAGIENYTDQQIASAFGAWCHVGGAVSEELLERRIMETKMFLYDDYSCTADGWSRLKLDAGEGKNDLSDVALYKTGEAYGVLPSVTRNGYYFAGWQTADGTVLNAADIAGGNLDVTALWSAVPLAEEPMPTAEPAPTPTPTAPPTDPTFPDVAAGAWYAGYVTVLASTGVVNGYPDGSFQPDNTVTWGEALKLILLSAGFPEQTPEDGDESAHWAAGYLRYAEKKGYTVENAVTDLDAAITRDEIADLTAAALELSPDADYENPYADSTRRSVLALYAAGIMEGSLENGLRLYKGADNIKRSELCAVLTRVLDYVEANFVFVSNVRTAIDFDLRFNSYDVSAFRTADNGRIYYDGADCAPRYGIDVSAHQGEIDWAAVAADGIEFAIIRCGYRGYGAGSLNEDEYFRKNVAGAIAAGLDVGIYFFSQAISVEEALEEAEYTLDLIKDYQITYPVVFDWEQITYSGSRTAIYSGETVTDCTVAFCDAMAAAGYTPMTYFNKTMAYLKLDLSRLQGYDGWLAWYHEAPDYVYDYQMWQYGSSGSVKGIAGNVDMNIAFRDFAG